jgi:hypothetical protein
MLDRIVSGGKTGAERAAWHAAQAYGVPTGGWMPRGFRSDDGHRFEFADQYGAAEAPDDDDLARIERNVRDSDATLWFGETTTPGAQATVGACQRLGKPCLPVSPDASFEPDHVASWIVEAGIGTLNVAGNREGDEPGIAKRVELFLGATLQRLGHRRT